MLFNFSLSVDGTIILRHLPHLCFFPVLGPDVWAVTTFYQLLLWNLICHYLPLQAHCLHRKWLLRSPAGHTAAICHHSINPSYSYQVHAPAMFATILFSHLILHLNKNRSWFLPMPRSVPLPHVCSTAAYSWNALSHFIQLHLPPNSTYYSKTNSDTCFLKHSRSLPIVNSRSSFLP